VRPALVALVVTIPFVVAPGGAAAAATNGKIAFASDRNAGDLEIYSMNADGSGQTRLTNSPGDDSFPSWSKDGSQIAFQTARTGCSAIFRMNGDGTNQTAVTDGTSCDQEPTWNPTGTQSAFIRDLGTDVEIFKVNTDGSSPVQLTNTPGSFNVDPVWGLNDKIRVHQQSRRQRGDLLHERRRKRPDPADDQPGT
jgi:Tol biopolymer transport system component